MPSAQLGGFKYTPGGKFLVVRRDGTIPKWTWFVLGARDPFAYAALQAYATAVNVQACHTKEKAQANKLFDYRDDIRQLAEDFRSEREKTGNGDPEATPHRPENLAIKSLMLSKGEADLRGLNFSGVTIILQPGENRDRPITQSPSSPPPEVQWR